VTLPTPCTNPTPFLRPARYVLFLFALCFASGLALRAAEAAKKTFDIPAGNVVASLKLFATQSGTQVIFPEDAIEGARTPALKGDFTPNEAIDRLLTGTNLVAARDAKSGAFAVNRSPGPRKDATDPNAERAAQLPKRDRPDEQARAAIDRAASQNNDTTTLSPFEVNTDRDVGYIASQSLAGGRLNTDLRDTAVAISVFTKEFLDDIGALTVNDALEYGLNTATEYDATGNLHVGNNFNFRIRGISGAQRSRNLFRTQLNLDSYNTERLDFSRGPNAILFGEGSPAGLINTSTKVARTDRNLTTIQTRVGSFAERRVALDLNRRLASNLALRANILWQDSGGYREFEFDKKKAATLAGTWRPFRRTTVKVDLERANFDSNRARPWTPVDRYSVWEAAGRPGSGSPTTWGEATPNTNGFFSQQVFFFPTGVLAGQAVWIPSNQQLRASSGPATVPGINTSVNVLDERIVPRNANLTGPGALSKSHYTVGGASIEQQIGDNLFIELAMNGEYEERLWANPVGFADIGYRLDANLYMPTFGPDGRFTGTARNPYFGKPFIYGQVSNQYNRFYREQYRATASYNLDFTRLLREKGRLARLLGHHRFAAMLSDEGFDRDQRSEREVNVSPNRVQTDLFNTQNAILRISYLDLFSANRADRGHLNPSAYPIRPQVLANNITRSVEAGLVNNNWTWSKTDLETRMFAMQNFFLSNRLVTTFGWRKDELKVYSATTTKNSVNAATGFVRGRGPDRVIPGDTFTRGVVGHVLPWASVYYNESDNFTSQDALQLFGPNGQSPIVGNRTGTGKDAGVKFELFGGRLYTTFGWYKTADADQVTSVNGVFLNYTEAIWSALGKPTDIEGRDTRSLQSKGYEFELTANPTRRLRISLSAKKAETVVDNLLTHVSAYVEAHRAEWAANASAPVNTSLFGGTRPTVGGVINQIDEQLVIERAPQGRAPYQDREITGNLFASYRFDSGTFKGLMFGGGAQYRGPALITYRVSTTGAPVYTEAYTMATGMVGYSMKLSRKIDFRVQLNIDNLFNFTDPQPVQGGEPPVGTTNIPLKNGIAYAVSLPVPRKTSITFTVGF
jgi:iron complex outermembrane receptor protein